MNGERFLTGLTLLACASAAVAAAPKVDAACTLKIENAWVRAAPPGATMMAGYPTVRNPCDRPIAIVGVESLDFGSAMVHQTLVENGVSKMRHADRLVVPAKGEVRFAPGGTHLMLMRPERPMPEGSKARIRLVLADGSRVYAEFDVRREPPAAK